MKGLVLKGLGQPEEVLKVEEIEKPMPGDGHVLIKVKASSINISDYMHFIDPVEGREVSPAIKTLYEQTGFIGNVVGMDASGIVEEVGSGVTRFKKGDEVYGITAGRIAAWAEYTLANEADLMLKPFEMTFEAAATLPTGALVALGACRVADVNEGQTVLVNGASGGVGTALVQILVAMGAKVTAVCSTRNVNMVRNFGIEQVIDYATEDFTKNAKTYDCIFGVNGYRSLEEYKAALNPGGMYVLVGNMRQGAEFHQRGLAVFQDSGKRLGAVASQMTNSEPDYISSLVAGGKLKPIVDSVYSIQNVSNAVRDIVKNHARGKIAIKMDFREVN